MPNKNYARAYTRSSSFQMALFFTLLCGITALILVYFGNYFSRDQYVKQTEAVLETEIDHIRLWSRTEDIIASLKGRDRVFLFIDKDNKIIDGNIQQIPKTSSVLSEGTILFESAGNKYAAKIETFNDGRRLLIGVNITDLTRIYKKMQWLTWLSIFLIFLVILTSYIISQFVVKGTNRIAVTAQKIMDTGDLSRRIELSSKWDDLGYMTNILNKCFDQIEHLMDGISHVSDNIAHDLKTPLTRLRNDLEDFKKEADQSENTKLHAHADKLISEADHLLNTFNALLRIARIEAGKQKTKFSPVSLKNVIDDALDLYDPLAEDKNIVVTKDISEMVINGDKDLLFQLFANLIDNAIKFTPEQGTVDMKASISKESIIFTIADSGVGVPEDDKNKIFDRFYRSDKSRHTPGSGLGLSMVKAIVELHRGTIEFEDNNPGTKVKVRLPL